MFAEHLWSCRSSRTRVQLTAADIYRTPSMHVHVTVRSPSVPRMLHRCAKTHRSNAVEYSPNKLVRKLCNTNLQGRQRFCFFHLTAEQDTGKQCFKWHRKKKNINTHISRPYVNNLILSSFIVTDVLKSTVTFISRGRWIAHRRSSAGCVTCAS